MRVASRCSASKGTNTSKRSDRYQCALATNVERIEPPQAGASRPDLLSVTTTDALLAGKVQRKVSNAIAGLAAAGSSRHRQNIVAIPASASILLRLRRRSGEPSPGSELAPWERVLSE